MSGIYIPTGFSPNHDGRNDEFRPLIFGDIEYYHFAVYNRYGHLVFQSNDPAKAWDGTFKGRNQDYNTFVWICTYQLKGQPKETKKGTVVLVR